MGKCASISTLSDQNLFSHGGMCIRMLADDNTQGQCNMWWSESANKRFFFIWSLCWKKKIYIGNILVLCCHINMHNDRQNVDNYFSLSISYHIFMTKGYKIRILFKNHTMEICIQLITTIWESCFDQQNTVSWSSHKTPLAF